MKGRFSEPHRASTPEPDLSISISEKGDVTNDEDSNMLKPDSRPSKPKSDKKWYKPPYSKKEKWLIAGIIVLILVIIGGLVTYLHYHNKPPVVKVGLDKRGPAAVVIKSRLTGLPVTLAQSQLPVTGVMIENSDQARPQSGLSQAGVIFEALAEGGITRFLALYEEGQPSSIGPIRSARPYFIDWLLPFNAAYAHVGGSPTALSDIQSENVRNMDEFSDGSSYTRISSRQAPHNVYTSMATLMSLEKTKGWTTSNFVGFPRKTDSPSKTPTAATVNFSIGSSDMTVNYTYDSTLNSYKRSEGGAPMTDANTGKQLEPKVVIAMVVPWMNGPIDASGAYYTEYSDIGNGQAYIFQDGTVTIGTWSKSSPTSQLQFGNANGAPLALNAGQTWITAVGTSSAVTYSQ